MIPQLDMSAKALLAIGFIQEVSKGKVYYRRDTLNGYIYFNPAEDVYVWYLRTIIGDYSNDIHLNISTLDDLNTLLRIVPEYKANLRPAIPGIEVL